MKNRAAWAIATLTAAFSWAAPTRGDTADMAALVNARTGVERVYHAHRTGTKKPFAEAVPAQTIEAKVRLALKKERLLEEVYGTKVTPEMLAAEVARIERDSRSPEMLGEIKAALGGDRELFAEVFAKPVLVERELRRRYDNDDARHAAKRKQVAAVRNALLAEPEAAKREPLLASAAEGVGDVTAITWQLDPRPKDAGEEHSPRLEDLPPGIGPLGPGAKVLSSPRVAAEDRKSYFEDLHPELRRTLAAQLGKAGDVSAVIEVPRGFLLYLATAKNDKTLSVKTFAVQKKDYGTWVKEAK